MSKSCAIKSQLCRDCLRTLGLCELVSSLLDAVGMEIIVSSAVYSVPYLL